MRLELDSLKRAVTSLERAVRVASDGERMSALDEDQQDTIRAGVIQNFEFTYELCWKMLKRQLEASSPSADEIDRLSYRDLMRVGAERGYIDDPNKWFDYRGQRNRTAHTYDEKTAESVFKTAFAFTRDARLLLERLEARNADD